VFVQEPGQVQWTYTLSEFAIRGMTSGETETIIVPITVFEDGVRMPRRFGAPGWVSGSPPALVAAMRILGLRAAAVPHRSVRRW